MFPLAEVARPWVPQSEGRCPSAGEKQPWTKRLPSSRTAGLRHKSARILGEMADSRIGQEIHKKALTVPEKKEVL